MCSESILSKEKCGSLLHPGRLPRKGETVGGRHEDRGPEPPESLTHVLGILTWAHAISSLDRLLSKGTRCACNTCEVYQRFNRLPERQLLVTLGDDDVFSSL